MPVFDRIEMDVIEVPHKILLVTQGVLPIAPLPTPRSPLAARLAEIRSPPGRRREKALLINRHRSGKSGSPSGKVQTMCK
jgi:hypothetical protein